MKIYVRLDGRIQEIECNYADLDQYEQVSLEERVQFLKSQKKEIFDIHKDGTHVQFICPHRFKGGHTSVWNNFNKYSKANGVVFSENYYGQEVGILFDHPQYIDLLKTPYKILYLAWESTKMPNDWNFDGFDEIWCISEFVQKALKESYNLNSKVYYQGIDSDVFKPKDNKNDAYTFLHFDSFKYRKGWDLVVKAFEKADIPNSKLILKTTDHTQVIPLDYKNVEVIKSNYTDEQMANLINSSDCVVFPSRGEGFGMPVAESIACGVPCITSPFGGCAEIRKAIFVDKGKFVPARYDNFQGDLGYYWEADIDALASKMKELPAKFDGYVDERTDAKLCVKEVCEKVKSIKVFRHKPLLSIIVLTHNAYEYSLKCFESIAKNTECNYELIVIENGSTDETRERISVDLARLFGCKFKLFLNENLGVARGRNEGIKHATGDFICYLDNDTEVGAGWDKRLLDNFGQGNVGVVGKAGNLVSCFNPLVFRNYGVGVKPVDVVAGFCFCFKSKLVEEIGNNVEDMGKFWHEDLDFCTRVRKAGYLVIEDPEIPLVHHEHKSVPVKHVTNNLVKEHYEGFDSKARKVGIRNQDDNVIFIYRTIKKKDTAYELIALNLAREMRKLGWVVIIKDSIPRNLAQVSESFYLCLGMVITYKGLSFAYLHQENNISPDYWSEDVKKFDFIIPCSEFSKKALPEARFLDCSLSGVAISAKGQMTDKYNDGKINLLFVGAVQPRKGTDVLVDAFLRVNRGDLRLIIKSGSYGLPLGKQDPRIEFIHANYSEQEMADLYHTVSKTGYFVSAHRSEGVGMPLLEAQAYGCNIIMSDYGEPKNRIKKFIPIGGNLVKSIFHNNPSERFYSQNESPMWFEPSLDNLVSILEKIKSPVPTVPVCEYSYKQIAKRFSKLLKSNKIRL